VERQNTDTPQSARGAITVAAILLMPVTEPRAPTSTTKGRHLHSVTSTTTSFSSGIKTGQENNSIVALVGTLELALQGLYLSEVLCH